MAPSSLWGGSRESLPLSVLSANIDGGAPSLIRDTSRINPSNERASIYSSHGVIPALSSDRNSFYAGKQSMGDAASVRSGLLGHGRAESITGSVAGVTSPLASPIGVAGRDIVAETDETEARDDKAASKEAPGKQKEKE